MLSRWVCPQDHRWEAAAPSPGAPPVKCPACGDAGQPLPPSSIDLGPTVALDPNSGATQPPPGHTPHTPPASGSAPRRPTVPGFELLDVLGRGGMGVVYKARQVKLNRVVALKMILAGGHASAAELQRFRAEAEAVAQLKHPHIVQVYSIGEHAGLPFFALEFVDGGTLASKLDGTPLPPRPAARLVQTLARAVEHAHRHGVVHRDLKPSNVLLATDEGGEASGAVRRHPFGVPKIADFGLAKRLDAATGQTQSGSIVGTPSYMAPEQAAGQVRAVGPAADVYALGAILYELLTGRPPFVGDTPLETILQVTTRPPVPPRQVRRDVPRGLETVCLKCLHKEPKKRYATAGDLADDLGRYLEGQSVKARRTPPWERAARWAWRRPVAAAALALVLLAAGGAGAVFAPALARVVRNQGRVTFVAPQPGVKLLLKQGGQEVATVEPGQTNRLLLPAGDYEVELVDGPHGLEVADPRFTLRRNGEATVRVVEEYVGELPDRLEGHADGVRALAVSADGSRALTGAGQDPALRLWDLSTGQARTFAGGHPGGVYAVALSPDGKRALSGGADKALRLWDAETGKPLRRLFGHTGEVHAVAFSPDGTRALSGGADKMLRVWDVTTGEAVRAFPAHDNTVTAVCWLPDGRRALSAGLDRAVVLWDADKGTMLRRYPGHGAAVADVAVSPDGTRALTACDDGNVRLWDVGRGRLLGVLARHQRAARAVAFSPDGLQAVSGGADRVVYVWDLRSGQAQAKFQGHGDGVACVAYLPGGRHVLSAGGLSDGGRRGQDFAVRKWAAPRPRRQPAGALAEPALELTAFTGHLSEVRQVAFAPDGRHAYSGDHGGGLRQWDLNTGRLVKQFRGPAGRILCLAVSPDGTRLLTGSGDNQLVLWDTAAGKPVRVLSGPFGEVCGVAFSADGRRALVGCGHTHLVALFDLDGGRLLRTFAGHTGPVESVAFHPDGKHGVSASHDMTLCLWDLSTGKEVRRYVGHVLQVWGVAVSRDGKRLVSGSHDKTVRVWDTATGKQLWRLEGHTEPVVSVALTPDGRHAVSGGWDGKVRLWDVTAGRAANAFEKHTSKVFGVAISPGGGRALSGGSDQSVRLWQLPAPGAGAPAARGTGELAVRGGGAGARLMVYPAQAGAPAKPADTLALLAPGAAMDLAPGSYQVALQWGASGAYRVAPTAFELKAGGRQVVQVERDKTFVGQVREVSLHTARDPTRVALCRDGRTAVLHCNSDRLHVWDLLRGKQVRELGTKGQVVGSGLAVSADGQHALTGTTDGKLKLWRLDGRSKPRTYPSFGAVPRHLALLHGDRALSDGPKNTLVLWSLKDGKELRRFAGHALPISNISVSPDGKHLLSSAGAEAWLWEVDTGAEVAELKGHAGAVPALAFSADGAQALTGGDDGAVRRWQVPSGKPLRGPAGGHLGGVYRVAFAPDGRFALSAGADQVTRLWDLESGRERRRFGGAAAQGGVGFSPDARLAHTATPYRAQLWQLPILEPGPDGAPADCKGQLVVESEDLSGRVEVRQGGRLVLTLSPAGVGHAFADLPAGDYELRPSPERDGLELAPRRVTVAGGEQVSARARWVKPLRFDRGVLRGAAADAALKALQEREAEGADKEALRADALALGQAFPGHPQALGAAALLRRLPSPLDGLKADKIDPEKLEIAGGGDPKQAPPGLVAVLGAGRFRHAGVAQALAASADGTRLAAACSDGTVAVFALPSGRLLHTLTGHKGAVLGVAFRPDGKALATGGGDGTVRLWDLEAGRAARTLTGHKGQVNAVAYSLSGRVLASGGADGKVRLWDLVAMREAGALDLRGIWVWSLAYSPDGARLAVGAGSGARLFNVTWRSESARLAHPGAVHAVAFTPDGKALATGGADSQIRVWELTGRGVLRHTLDAPPGATAGAVRGLAFSADGATLASATSSQAGVRVWDAAAGKLVRTLAEGVRGLNALAALPRSKRFTVAAAGAEGVVRLWDAGANKPLWLPEGHLGAAHAVAFSPRGHVLASAGQDGTVRVWSCASGELLHTWRPWPAQAGEVTSPVLSLAFRPDGGALAVGDRLGRVALLDAVTGKVNPAPFPPAGQPVTGLTFSPDGRHLAVGGPTDGYVYVKDLTTRQRLPVRPSTAAFTPDGRLLAYRDGGRVHFWDTGGASPYPVRSFVVGQPDGLLALRPDGGLLATTGSDGSVKLWALEAGGGPRTLGGGADADAVVFRPDGRGLALAGKDGVLRLWQLPGGKEPVRVRLGTPERRPTALAYSPDGRYLAAANATGTIYIFKVVETAAKAP